MNAFVAMRRFMVQNADITRNDIRLDVIKPHRARFPASPMHVQTKIKFRK